MPDTSVRTNQPPEQAELVPDDWTYIGEWRTPDRVGLELYMCPGSGEGRPIAIPPKGKAVRAATVADADGHFTLGWTSEIDRPESWQNAQRALALRRYQEFKEARR